MSRRLAALAVLASCLALAAASPAAFADTSMANPPPGANDFRCKPSRAHPEPVVLVHGLGATMGENWGYISPLLAARGYCVFALTYGLDPRFPYFGGVIPIERSAPELGAFVDRVLAATRARKVDLVGHSEGTFMPEYWLKYLGGAPKVSRYVAMTPLYAGTQLGGLPMLQGALAPLGLSKPATNLVGSYCGSCSEFLAGSDMVKKINAGGAAVPGIRYTTIPTTHDELVVPYTSGILHAPNVTNHVLQDVCPTDLSEHLAEATDPVVAQLIFNALDPAHAAPVRCGALPPLAGAAPGGATKSPARTCAAPRTVVIRVARRGRIARARATVGGRRVSVRRLRHARVRVTLRSRPHRAFSVIVHARMRDGRRIRVVRHYHVRCRRA